MIFARTDRMGGGSDMRIGLVDLFVDDQEKARKFYTEVLGLQVTADMSYGDERWLTVVSADDPDGTQLKLAPLTSEGAALQAAHRERGEPTISFTTPDIQRSYKELSDSGAVFRSEPQQYGYGGTDAVFEDGCGNLLNLHQEEQPGGEDD
jgi:catechol 2,3-dioxygenase-like lactoylglutathione lyase family enzyme